MNFEIEWSASGKEAHPRRLDITYRDADGRMIDIWQRDHENGVSERRAIADLIYLVWGKHDIDELIRAPEQAEAKYRKLANALSYEKEGRTINAAKYIEQLEAALKDARQRLHQLDLALMNRIRSERAFIKYGYIAEHGVKRCDEALETAEDTPPDDKFTPCPHCGMVPFTSLLTIHAEGCPQTVEDSGT